MAQRQLLWLAPQADTFQPSRRVLQGWQPYRLNLDRNPAHERLSLPFPRIGLLDLSGPGVSNAHFLQDWVDRLHPTHWVGLLDEAPRPGSNSAFFVSNYCVDFHTLPCDQERLRSYLGHLWGMAILKSQVGGYSVPNASLKILEGGSEAIIAIRTLLHRYAHTHEPVMILGATGTGKESAARFIHEHSSVSRGPFVAVHCAALPESLTQSELFGHEKGAFTNAITQRLGRIEAANGGTLLLDGVDELLPQQQSMLLRFLQEGQIERLGSIKPRRVDVRVISTSSKPPELLVEEGRFRADLFYRLSVLQVNLPLLSERVEDLPLLVEHVQTSISNVHVSAAAKKLSARAMTCIFEHAWPGNIRELQNRLRRAALMSESAVIEPRDLGLDTLEDRTSDTSGLTLEHFRAQAEQRAVMHSLALSNHNVSAAARLLKISRLSLYRLMEKYGLERGGPRKQPSLKRQPVV